MSKRVGILAVLVLLAAAAPVEQEGDILWTRQFGTDARDIAQSVSTDASGNVFVAGNTSGVLPSEVPPAPTGEGSTTENEGEERRFVIVLGVPPVDSPASAVRAAIVDEFKRNS